MKFKGTRRCAHLIEIKDCGKIRFWCTKKCSDCTGINLSPEHMHCESNMICKDYKRRTIDMSVLDSLVASQDDFEYINTSQWDEKDKLWAESWMEFYKILTMNELYFISDDHLNKFRLAHHYGWLAYGLKVEFNNFKNILERK